MASRSALRLAIASSSRLPATAPRIAAGAHARYSSTSSPDPPSSTSSSSAAVPTPTPPATASIGDKGKSRARDPSLELPILPRPLGVPNKPSPRSRTWTEARAQLLDEDRHKAKRKALIKEAKQGYFHDYNRARSANGGKLWLAPPVLIREDRALYFPDIHGKALTGSTVHTTDLLLGKITLLSILTTRLSEEHAQSFCAPVVADWPDAPEFQYVQINHQQNALKSMLLNLFVSSLKRTIPKDRWDKYLVSGGEWSAVDITDPLGIENQILGFIYLVDQNAKVRWAGNAMATPKESEDLRRATAVLMRRLKEGSSSETTSQ